ncbi:hypothetical protein LIA77_06952 [Sarocladium implicatum]|nr:hypothetical protein LIA77_06952 [Sarocladium implicatum]
MPANHAAAGANFCGRSGDGQHGRCVASSGLLWQRTVSVTAPGFDARHRLVVSGPSSYTTSADTHPCKWDQPTMQLCRRRILSARLAGARWGSAYHGVGLVSPCIVRRPWAVIHSASRITSRPIAARNLALFAAVSSRLRQ